MQKLNEEFKLFLRWRGFNIDAGIFDIKLTPPQNFASYRQSELDTARIANFSAIEPLGYLSKRFALKRFLGLTDEEILENETLWKEERADVVQSAQGSDMRSVGISPGGMESDISTGEEMADSSLGAPDLGGEAPAAAPGAAPEPTAPGL
jgi:hypothetical protein